MDAVKFIEEARRRYKVTGKATSVMLNKFEPESIVKDVEEWSPTHPTKTRQSVFLEQWPEAMTDSKHILSVCPQYIDRTVKCARVEDTYKYGCADCRAKFWGQEAEEN